MFDDPLGLGMAYAMYRHGQDRQAEQIMSGLAKAMASPPTGQPYDLPPPQVTVVAGDDDQDIRGQHPVPNAVDHSTLWVPDSWQDFIGQEKVKRQLLVYIAQAQNTNRPLPHTLLASGMPGVGKTTLARMIAEAMDVRIIELVPPFNVYTLVDAASQLSDGDILFIDEIHKLADGGKKGAEILLKVLEDFTAFLPNGEVVELAEITVVGATTDRDLLPEPVLDRFRIKPEFEPYSDGDMAAITGQFAIRHGAYELIYGKPNEPMPEEGIELGLAISAMSRGTPRVAEEYLMAAVALSSAYGGRRPTPEELCEFVDVQPDGLTRSHVTYLIVLYGRFGRKVDHGMEYVAGETTMQSILRETKNGISRIERYLLELGLIERTPRGRALTEAGIERAMELTGELVQ